MLANKTTTDVSDEETSLRRVEAEEFCFICCPILSWGGMGWDGMGWGRYKETRLLYEKGYLLICEVLPFRGI